MRHRKGKREERRRKVEGRNMAKCGEGMREKGGLVIM